MSPPASIVSVMTSPATKLRLRLPRSWDPKPAVLLQVNPQRLAGDHIRLEVQVAARRPPDGEGLGIQRLRVQPPLVIRIPKKRHSRELQPARPA